MECTAGSDAMEMHDKHESGCVRVLLADDHVLYREGLRLLIGDWKGFEVIGEAENGFEAVEFVRAHHDIDLVLLDVFMPKMSGVEAVKRIHALRPTLPVVMLTVSAEDEDVFGALENGASGYVLKDTTARHLRNRLLEVLEGKGALSAEAAAVVIRRISNSTSCVKVKDAVQGEYANTVSKLTSVDLEILRLVRDGASNDEIAATMYMSVPSIKKRLSKYLRLFNVENRVQLAVLVGRMDSLIG